MPEKEKTRTAICYFSGTGNSLDIAEKMQKPLNAELFYIPKLDMNALAGYTRIILVSPVYLFGLPVPTKGFIEGLPHGKEYIVVLHYGGFAGNASHYAKMYFEKNGLQVRSIHTLTMPENFSFVATVPQWFIKRSLAKTQRKVDSITDKIIRGIHRVPRKSVFAGLDKLHEKNAAKWATTPQSFVIAESCDHCGFCARICPVGNIKASAGSKPEFANNCVCCLACFHRCPKAAINYGKKTIGKPRYVNPNVDLSQMDS